jgi:hypothetical protein
LLVLTNPDLIACRHLTLLNVRSTAINAKIRNYVPNRIHVWYDNYQGGLFQGFLELGEIVCTIIPSR